MAVMRVAREEAVEEELEVAMAVAATVWEALVVAVTAVAVAARVVVATAAVAAAGPPDMHGARSR